MDEKPYRFNACGGDKVWAKRGQKSVKCKELRSALLERWTGITAVLSRRHESATIPGGGWQPKWAALFRAKTGERCNVTSPDPRCQVLYAEKGSVTGDTWLQYLDHILPVVRDPEHAIVPVTDWYAPHLSETAMAFGLERTLSPTLMIGGGTTGEAAVCDKTPHRFMAQRYKEHEMCAHTNSLNLRPHQVPRWTKQQVLLRGWQTWQDHDHSCGEELCLSHGYTNKVDVDGSEDSKLDSSIVHFWSLLNMKEARMKLKGQVRLLQSQCLVTHWSDAADLLEPHDPHRVAFEGEEDAPIYECDDGEDDDFDTDDDEPHAGG